MKKCNNIFEQVNENTENIKIINGQLPFKYYTYNDNLYSTDNTCLKSETNAPTDAKDGYILAKNATLFKINGVNDNYFLLTYYANLKGQQGNKGDKGDKGNKGDDGRDGLGILDVQDIKSKTNYCYISTDDELKAGGKISYSINGENIEINSEIDIPLKNGNGVNIDASEDGKQFIISASESDFIEISGSEQGGTIEDEQYYKLLNNHDLKVKFNDDIYYFTGVYDALNALIYSSLTIELGATTPYPKKAKYLLIARGIYEFGSAEIGSGGSKKYLHTLFCLLRESSTQTTHFVTYIINNSSEEMEAEDIYSFVENVFSSTGKHYGASGTNRSGSVYNNVWGMTASGGNIFMFDNTGSFKSYLVSEFSTIEDVITEI